MEKQTMISQIAPAQSRIQVKKYMEAYRKRNVLGDFCDRFTTEDVYSYYNNMASQTGALGVLAIIPMAAIYLGWY